MMLISRGETERLGSELGVQLQGFYVKQVWGVELESGNNWS